MFIIIEHPKQIAEVLSDNANHRKICEINMSPKSHRTQIVKQ